MAFVEQTNKGMRSIPTIVFPDGSVLVEPSNAELAEKLGMQTRAKRSFYDAIIISIYNHKGKICDTSRKTGETV